MKQLREYVLYRGCLLLWLPYFVGVGGSVGYLSSLLGRDLPGVAPVAAFAQVCLTPVIIQLPRFEQHESIASMHVWLLWGARCGLLCGSWRQCGLPEQPAGS
jgi:hypothetical protein